MREILYKGKAKSGYKWVEEGEWIEGSLFYFEDEDGIICQIVTSYLSNKRKDEPVMATAYEIDPETVCEYTGKQDKNGKQIFEGDIIRYNKKLFKVVWVSECAHFALHPLKECSWSPCMNTGTVKNAEVIGNVFENPELLEELEEQIHDTECVQR